MHLRVLVGMNQLGLSRAAHYDHASMAVLMAALHLLLLLLNDGGASVSM